MKLNPVLGLLPFLSFGTAQCIWPSQAQQVANNFASLFSNFSVASADAYLTPGFTDQTDSVSWLINNGTNCPKVLGQNTLNSRADYIAAQSTQPNLPFVVENVWNDCSNVIIRWFFNIKPQRVQGIAVLGVVQNFQFPQSLRVPWLINHVYSEFNTGAFIVDQGWYHGVSPCGKNAKRECEEKRLAGMGMPAYEGDM